MAGFRAAGVVMAGFVWDWEAVLPAALLWPMLFTLCLAGVGADTDGLAVSGCRTSPGPPLLKTT
jgi:hypothetical protein